MPQTCPQCQTEAADDANHCSNCGAPLGAGVPTQAAPPPGAAPPSAAATAAGSSSGSSLPPYKFDIKRLALADLIAGVATLVLLISLFLDWFTASYKGFTGGSASGVTAHGYLYFVFVICLLIFAYLAAVAGWGNLPFAPQVPHLTVMLVATIVNFVITFIAFIFKPSVPIITNVSVGWSFGAVLALLAAIVAAAPYAIPQIRARTM